MTPIKNLLKFQETRNKVSYNRNLLDYSYHQNYYKLVGINLSRKKNTTIPQQIRFTENAEEDDGTL